VVVACRGKESLDRGRIRATMDIHSTEPEVAPAAAQTPAPQMQSLPLAVGSVSQAIAAANAPAPVAPVTTEQPAAPVSEATPQPAPAAQVHAAPAPASEAMPQPAPVAPVQTAVVSEPPVVSAPTAHHLIASIPAEGMRVIALANQKGGVAKTTTTLNLAVAFAEQGNRVLCIDMDPQGNLTMSQGLDPDQITNSMYNLLIGQTSIRQIIHKREIDIAVSSIDLAGAELAMASMIGRERSLQKALAEVKDDYDFVFIDTPPSLGLLTINALTAAHRVIVPVQCEYLSMRGLLQLQNTLAMIREHLNPEIDVLGILPTMLDTRTLHAQEAIELLEENFAGRVFRSRISRTVRFAEAPVKGMSVLKYEPEGNAAKSYRDLAKEIMESVV